MKTLLNGLTNAFSSKNSRTAPRSAFRPGLESLETRECLSVTIGTVNSGHTLKITGDIGGNAVTVTQDDDHNLLTVVAGGQTKTFTSSQINAVVVDLKAGGDVFTYKLGGGSDFKFAKNIQVEPGAGSDTANFDFANDGSGGNAEIRANLTVAVNEAFGGDERVDVVLGQVDDVAVLIKTRLNFGNDTFTGTLKGELVDHASVKFDLVDRNNFLTSRGGNDRYTIHADNDIDIDDDAVLDVAVFGASGNDTIDFAYQGEIDGLLKVRLDGGDGADKITAVFDIEGDSDGRLDVKVFGGTGNDILTLNIDNNAGNDLTILNAVLDGGTGADSGIATSNVTKISC